MNEKPSPTSSLLFAAESLLALMVAAVLSLVIVMVLP